MEQGNTSACGEDDRMICPMCDFEQSSAEECIRCGTVIRKYLKKVNSPSVIASPVGSTQDGRKSTGRSFRVSWLLPVPVIVVLVIMLAFIKFFGKESKQDDFYSGLFIILTK